VKDWLAVPYSYSSSKARFRDAAMPRSGVSIPSYCHHKAKGLAYAQLNGWFIYLGPYNSPESKVA
jgi:hypothetical protein